MMRGLLPHRRYICFFGDSHMRHLYNSFATLVEGSGRADEFWTRDKGVDRYVLKAQRSSYTLDTWGDPGNMSACTDVFANFGQASACAGDIAWNFGANLNGSWLIEAQFLCFLRPSAAA